MTENITISLSPFNSFDNFLTALYTISNYPYLSIQVITELINKLTKSDFNISDYENLRTKLNRLPHLYGKSFFSNLNLNETIESILDVSVLQTFESDTLSCTFCNSVLSKNG